MKYLAALDYAHLDNGLFLTNFAQALAQHQRKGYYPIVVHADSAYTDRIIQTGVMREEATIRAIKDLNHRLIALLADEGVSAVGLNGFQRQCISIEGEDLQIDLDYFEALPSGPALVLSNLVYDQATGRPAPVDLSHYLEFLGRKLNPDHVFLFSRNDSISPREKNADGDRPIPPETLSELHLDTDITTAAAFKDL